MCRRPIDFDKAMKGRIIRYTSPIAVVPTTGAHMNPTRIIGIVLIIAGCLGLAYGGFSYNKETTGLKLGSFEVKVQEKETVTIPLLVSGAVVAIGIFLLVAGGRK